MTGHTFVTLIVWGGLGLSVGCWTVGWVGSRRVGAAPWGPERSAVRIIGRVRPYDWEIDK